MAILSVDLAYRRWSDLGIVILRRTQQAKRRAAAPAASVACEIIPLGPPDLDGAPRRRSSRTSGKLRAAHLGPVDPEILAGRLNHLCVTRGINLLMLDGPQAWKSPSNGFAHARVSERQLNTAAKTGLPGLVLPRTYRTFSEFCIDVYDALCRRGWRRFETVHQPPPLAKPGSPPQRLLVESYPHAAWRSLGLAPLPSKRRARISDIAGAYAALRSLVPFTTNRPPNHDQLQAIVGGLPGLAIEASDSAALRIVGNPPRREEGHWREGFIVLPLPPRPAPGLRWLN